MSYEPGPIPLDQKAVLEYLSRELRRISNALRDDARVVFYRTGSVTEGTLSAGVSANYRIGTTTNISRFSTSNTVTITGIADTTPNREHVFINVGTGVLVLKSEGTESSASHRFALSESLWQLSANASATLWYDVDSFRHRGISRT
jgi:hypothetical protein